MSGGGSNTKQTVQKVTRLPVSDGGPIGAKTKGTLASRQKSRTGGAQGTLLTSLLKDLIGSQGKLGA
jgi:hypothetical protein